MSVLSVVLSGRGHCDGPIPSPEVSYRVCVCVQVQHWPSSSTVCRLKKVRLRKKDRNNRSTDK